MDIQTMDPYPGRCRNHRYVAGPYSANESVRCLDYENVPHQCTFPGPPLWASVTSGGNYQTSVMPLPEPWVKPSVSA